MSTFDAKAFAERTDLSYTDLERLRKCNLIAIAQHLNVELTQGMKKAEILDSVASHMTVRQQTQSAEQAQAMGGSDQTQLELAKMEFEREKMRLEFEREREQRQREAEAEEKQRQREAEREQRQREAEAEERQRQREAEIEMRRLEMEMKFRELELSQTRAQDSKSHTFDVAKNVRLVLKFEEDTVDKYFALF